MKTNTKFQGMPSSTKKLKGIKIESQKGSKRSSKTPKHKATSVTTH